jgi:ornithine cyclodeaminase/alanine dehydrogenase-like protein (mu-crystallin family)
MPTLLLDRNAIKTLIEMSDVINVVEEAFKICGEGRGKMAAKTYLIQNGVYSIGDVYGTLAEVVAGKKGRANDKDITVFDSTGIAIEGIAVAKLLFEKAQQRGSYPAIGLVGT